MTTTTPHGGFFPMHFEEWYAQKENNHDLYKSIKLPNSFVTLEGLAQGQQ